MPPLREHVFSSNLKTGVSCAQPLVPSRLVTYVSCSKPQASNSVTNRLITLGKERTEVSQAW